MPADASAPKPRIAQSDSPASLYESPRPAVTIVTAKALPCAMNSRRFPPPWSVEEGQTYFVVKDNGGQKLAYVHFDDP